MLFLGFTFIAFSVVDLLNRTELLKFDGTGENDGLTICHCLIAYWCCLDIVFICCCNCVLMSNAFFNVCMCGREADTACVAMFS